MKKATLCNIRNIGIRRPMRARQNFTSAAENKDMQIRDGDVHRSMAGGLIDGVRGKGEIKDRGRKKRARRKDEERVEVRAWRPLFCFLDEKSLPLIS